MKVFKKAFFMFITLYLIWIMLTDLHSQELFTGAAVALIITLIFLQKAEIFAEIKLTPKALIYFIFYIFVFLWELIKSNLDVAFRVLHPKLPINPGIVKVKTKLNSKIGRIILANSITLTPGTLTVETKDNFFYIHWININSTDIEGATNAIVAKFEKYLEVIFG